MAMTFAIIAAFLVAAVAVLAWYCGRLKAQLENMRFQWTKAEAQLQWYLSDDVTRQGFGDDFTKEEWPEEI